MSLSDTEIHRAELLLTLNYLLKYSDENHPAKIMEICESANEYGLKFDKELDGKSGNDIKRQRISDCLVYLYDLSNKGYLPFTIEQTDGGKYYIEKRFDLTVDQISKIISSIQNEDLISTNDVDYLTDKIQSIGLSEFQKSEMQNSIILRKKQFRHAKKRYKILREAYDEKKLVCVRYFNYFLTSDNKIGVNHEDVWHRVIKLTEKNGHTYVYLLPLNKKGLLCKYIDELYIPITKNKSDYIMEDFTPKKKSDDIFKKNNGVNFTIQQYIDANKLLIANGDLVETTFYFSRNNEKLIVERFNEFFDEELVCKHCFKSSLRDKTFTENDDGDISFCNILINDKAFIMWLMSDLHKDGRLTVGELIAVYSPSSINKKLCERYNELLERYKKYTNN